MPSPPTPPDGDEPPEPDPLAAAIGCLTGAAAATVFWLAAIATWWCSR